MLVFYVGVQCWFYVLVFCVGVPCWFYVLILCVGCMCWFSVLVFCVGFPCWFSVLVFRVGFLRWLFRESIYTHTRNRPHKTVCVTHSSSGGKQSAIEIEAATRFFVNTNKKKNTPEERRLRGTRRHARALT